MNNVEAFNRYVLHGRAEWRHSIFQELEWNAFSPYRTWPALLAARYDTRWALGTSRLNVWLGQNFVSSRWPESERYRFYSRTRLFYVRYMRVGNIKWARDVLLCANTFRILGAKMWKIPYLVSSTSTIQSVIMYNLPYILFQYVVIYISFQIIVNLCFD